MDKPETDRPEVIRELTPEEKKKILRAFYLDVIMNIGLGLMVGVIFLSIGITTFNAQSTAGWDSTTLLIFKAWPWVAAAASLIATIRYAQNPSGY
jgi:hypothetical protein